MENVEFRVEAVADDQSDVRPGKLRHLMQMKQGAICLCVCVYCITFHIHTLPKKFILLPKIRADTFFPWHDSSFKSKRWLTILGTRIMTKRAPQYPSQLQANRYISFSEGTNERSSSLIPFNSYSWQATKTTGVWRWFGLFSNRWASKLCVCRLL